MTTNLDRFRTDLDRLIGLGDELENAMGYEIRQAISKNYWPSMQTRKQ